MRDGHDEGRPQALADGKTVKPDPRGNQNARDRNSRMIAVVQKRTLIDRFRAPAKLGSPLQN
jgi:hypothetical protein